MTYQLTLSEKITNIKKEIYESDSSRADLILQIEDEIINHEQKKIDLETIEYDLIHLENETTIEYKFFNQEFRKTPTCFSLWISCNSRHFEYQINYFIEQKHPLLILNYREHFGSKNPAGLKECSFKNIAEDIILLLDFLNIKKPHLIHSMGVNVALEIALTNNQLIDKIVLISGSPSNSKTIYSIQI